MAQAFVTTYNNAYRWHDINRRKSLRPVDKLAETLPEGDIWLLPKKIGEDDEEGKQGLAAAEAAIRKMYRKRLWTVYHVDYCREMMPKREDEEDGENKSFDSALLGYCRALYEPKKKMIPPPLPSARRVYGYIRPTNMYVPLSLYQNDYGRVAYHILDTNSRQKEQTAGDVKPIEGNNQEVAVIEQKETGKATSDKAVKRKSKKIDLTCKCAD